MEGEEKNQPETPNKNHKECNWRDWSHFQPFGCFITCLDAGGISTSPGKLICGPDTPSERPESKPLASQPLFWVRKVSTAWWPCPGIQEGSEELPKLARWTMESCDFKQKGVERDRLNTGRNNQWGAGGSKGNPPNYLWTYSDLFVMCEPFLW